ncbi:Calx-beta domain-containing protein, partial [Microcystis aeruginosa]|uniref:Calx-beta domain-containing protein n=1 Tax=Microcystis aeruginosa TaxID=1126 RepID=UPI0011BDBFF2
MNGANGGFSDKNRTIYLSSDYLSQASADRDPLTGLTGTLLEEIGHFVDSLINPGSDTTGDEGELFSAILMDLSLSPQEQERIAQENDHSFFSVNGQIIPIEQSLPDLAGNTLATARVVTVGATATTFTDFVGGLDRDDYYKFTLASDSLLDLKLTGLTADAYVRLLDSTGVFITGSFNDGIVNETIQRALTAGTYYIQVQPEVLADFSGWENTNYSLSLVVTSLPADNAGNTLATARVVTLGTTASTFNDFVGNWDQDDYYKLTLASNSLLDLKLTGLTASAYVELLDSTGAWITGSYNDGIVNETIQRALTAGTYYIQVQPEVLADFSGWENTNYSLSLVATASQTLPTITIAATDAAAGETATGVTANPGSFTLTRTGNTASTLTVNYTLSGTATKGTDYNNLTGTVSFAAGAATALININPIDDTLAEGSETVILTLGTGTGYTVGTTNTGTVTITDNEVLPVITIAATDGSAGETLTGVTANPGSFTLTRTGNTASTLTVNYTLSGTATKGTDYNNLTGTVSFAAGAATALININPIDDTLAEGSETVILTLGTGTGYTLGATNTATVTIADNEVLPVITIAATDGSAGETLTGQTANPGSFTLTRTGNTASTLTVNYTLSGTATKGTDYNNLTGTVSFAAGAATALININPIDDTLAEGSETVILTLGTGTGYTVGTTNTGTVTITDNEVVLPTITIAATDAAAGETATGVTANPGSFTLTRTGDLTQVLTVNYTVAGTGTKGTDYSNLTGTVSFAAGSATALVTITPIDDTLVEGNETAIVTLAAGTGYSVGTTNAATVTIADNEVLPVITIAATDASAGETVTGTTANPGTFTLTRTGDLTQALTVNYTVAGTGTKGTDYSNLTGTVSFAAGSATALVTITPIDDTLAEGNETVIVTLAEGIGYSIGTTNTATVTIAENEVLPVITIAATDGSAGETATGVTANPGVFTLTRRGSTAAALIVNYSLSGTGTKGSDYSYLTGTVSFAAGSATALVTITPIDDTLAEGNETVIVTLAEGIGYSIGTTNTATVTIAENEVLPVITIAATDGSAGETVTGTTANPGTFTLTRTGDVSQALTVNYTVAGSGTKGTDYHNLTGTVSFAAGSTKAFVDITPIDDTLDEGNETVIVTLAEGVGYIPSTIKIATVTLADNDKLPDLPGNTLATARTVTVGATTSIFNDFVGNGDWDDYYKLTLDSYNLLDIQLAGLTADANVRLLDSAGNFIAGSFKEGIVDETIQWGLTAGTYYVQVEPNVLPDFSGFQNTNYSLSLVATALPADNAGNTLATARVVTVGATTSIFNDFVGNWDRDDYYKFTLANYSLLDLKLTGLTANANIRLLDSAGEFIAGSFKEGIVDETIQRALTAGTYYVQVEPDVLPDFSGFQNTNYSLSLVATALPADNAGNTLATARVVTVGATTSIFNDFVGNWDRDDYYKFTLANYSLLDLKLTGLTANANIRLLDSTGAWITGSFNDGIVDETIQEVLTTGTYYIQVSPDVLPDFSGRENTNYSLSLVATALPADSAGNTLATARIVTLGGTASNFNDFVGNWDNDDYYKFTIVGDTLLDLKLTGLTAGAYVRLLDSTGSWITGSYNDGTADETIKRTLTAGTYYIQVTPDVLPDSSGWQNTNYSLKLTLPPIITVAPTDAIAGETLTGTAPNLASFTFTRTGDIGQALTVNYTIAGTATKGTDYNNLTGTVSFAAGAATTLVNITPIDDTLAEGNESVILTLGVGTGYTVGTSNNSTVKIIDNEVLPLITVTATDAIAGETLTGTTANPGTFTLTRTGDITKPRSINYALSGTGTKGTDYSNLTGTVSFASGVNTALVSIIPIDDTLAEASETVVLTLEDGIGYTLATTTNATVTIADNEIPVITVEATDAIAIETLTGVTANPGSFTLTRIGNLTNALTVNYTVAGTGTKGTDYGNLTGTVSFATGSATALVNIIPIDDTLAEGNETVILTLATGTGYTVGTTKTGTVTLADNDSLPDLAGNTLATARGVTVGATASVFNDFVGNGDENDYYKFTLATDSVLDLKLTGLTAIDTSVRLLDSTGLEITGSYNDGIADEAIQRILTAGTYYVQVIPDSIPDFSGFNNTKYNLSLVATALPADNAGNTLATARVVTVGATASTFNDFVGNRDRDDYYKFTLTSDGRLDLKLTGLTANAYVRLLDSTGAWITGSFNDGIVDETIQKALTTGTYYVQVTPNVLPDFSGFQNTNYSLSLVATALPADSAGNTLATARIVTLGGTASNFNDFVGNWDRDDYYKFTLTSDSVLDLKLTGLTANAYVRLLDSTGAWITGSFNDGIVDETIQEVL